MIDYEEYEALPKQDKWMAHATLPATTFFRLWKRKFEKLVWMALYNPQGRAGTAEWYISAATLEEEEDMLASDDEFEPDGHDNTSVDEDESGSDGEYVVDNEGAQIPSEEVDELMEDAYGEEAHQRRIDRLSQKDTAKYEPVDHPLSEPVDRLQPRWASLERKTKVSPSLPGFDMLQYCIGG